MRFSTKHTTLTLSCALATIASHYRLSCALPPEQMLAVVVAFDEIQNFAEHGVFSRDGVDGFRLAMRLLKSAAGTLASCSRTVIIPVAAGSSMRLLSARALPMAAGEPKADDSSKLTGDMLRPVNLPTLDFADYNAVLTGCGPGGIDATGWWWSCSLSDAVARLGGLPRLLELFLEDLCSRYKGPLRLVADADVTTAMQQVFGYFSQRVAQLPAGDDVLSVLCMAGQCHGWAPSRRR